MDFLSGLFHRGLSYSAINSARSAVVTLLSLCTDAPVGESSVLLQKFMKGIFNLRPSLPKTNCTWDVTMVLDHLCKLSPPKALDLLALSAKLVTLLLLLSGHRGQSIHALRLEDVDCSDKQLVIRFQSPLKQTRPGTHVHEVILPRFIHIGLCVVTTFAEYVKRTKPLRNASNVKLFLTTVRPHRDVSRDTVSKWVKRTLRHAGVNVAIFGSHSTRSASTSAACLNHVPLSTILKTAGWSNDSTFRRFYNKPVTRDTEFADSILTHAKQ